MARADKLKFAVFYDDENYSEEAKKAKELVQYLVDYLEKEGQKENWSEYKGYYKHRDALPGDNKMLWRIGVIQRAQYVLLVITPELLKKRWMRFWRLMTEYIQENREKGELIPLVYGIRESVIDAASNPSGRGPLVGLGIRDFLYVPEDYTSRNDWREKVLSVVRSGTLDLWEAPPAPTQSRENGTPMEFDKPEEPHVKTMRENQVRLLNSLRVDNIFLGYFQEKRVMSAQEAELIMTKAVQADRTAEVIRILNTRGPEGYQVLMDAMLETSQGHLANILDRTLANQRRRALGIDEVQEPADLSTGEGNRRQDTQMDSAKPRGSRTGLAIETDNVGDVSTVLRRSLDPAVCYCMTHSPRGHCLIINNNKFMKTEDHKADIRKGTRHDVDTLTNVFKDLDFEIDPHDDLTQKEILDVLGKASKGEYQKNADAFVLVILSHGEQNVVFGTDWKPVKFDEISALFEAKGCPHLINKPKAFIIQACQGGGKATGVFKEDIVHNVESDDVSSRDLEAPLLDDEDAVHQKADMLWAMATMSGEKAFRDTQRGTWFIHELVTHISGLKKEDHFMDILTRVTAKVAAKTELSRGYKQLPTCHTNLRKQWWFLPVPPP